MGAAPAWPRPVAAPDPLLEVAEQYRPLGIATQLVEAAEAWGRERGAASAITDTYLGSPLSIPFWEQRMQYRERSVVLVKELDG